MKTTFLLLCTGIALHVGAQQPIPAAKQKKSILLMNGIAHVGNGQVIENSVIGFKDGKITLIGDTRVMRIDMSAWDTTINITGKHVYPGFIAPNSTLGLTEIEAVRASNDFYEVGGYNPHVRSQIAYNMDSRIIPTVRTNGVLIAQITPRGGRISGTSSVMQLDGWNWTDATQRKDDGVHINWPSVYSRQWSDNGIVYEKSKNYETQKQELQQFFAEAKAYLENPGERNLRFEAMRGVFNGTQRLYIHADAVKDITESVAFAQKFGVKHIVIVGGADSWKCAEFLKTKNVSVMLNRVHSLPVRSGDDIDQPYKTAAQLYDAGVLFCFQNEGDQEAAHTRNLPFLAGTAVAYGLPKEQAIAALTGNTALILGIADRVGTLESNKDATLFISEGDALDMSTNKVTWAFIEGKQLDLRNEQQELNEIYLKKYGLQPK